MVKGKKKKREPFWKRWGPDWKHITDHAGRIIDNSNLSQATETALMMALAYIGVERTNDLRGAIIGPLGLKLAQSENLIAGASGVAMLAVLGLAHLPKDYIQETVIEPISLPVGKTKEEIDKMPWWERIFYPKNGIMLP